MSILDALRLRLAHVPAFWELRRYFGNPWLIAGLRLGLVKTEYFPYRIRKGADDYLLLGRPQVSSSADFFVLREVLVDEVYQDVLRLLPDRPLRVVDVGANVGAATIWLSRKVRLAEAFCFEPEPDSFRLLAFNLARNGCSCAHAIQKAVAGTSRTASIVLNQQSPGSTNIYDAPAGGGAPAGSAIEVIGFSEWLRQTPGQFDLLKMDCEGAEWEMIRQTTSSDLARFGAVVAEIHKDPEGRDSIESFPRLTESRGFRTVRWEVRGAGLYFGARDPERKA